MNYNIVTNYKINQFLKQNSKYYKVSLGQSITLEDRSGDRVANTNDQFAFVYNHHYKATILKQGIIGNITFYTDHGIYDDDLALYIDREEFVHKFDERFVREKGVDAYLGHILKTSQEEFDELNKEQMDLNLEKVGNAEKVLTNPGSVRFEDLKAWAEKKNQERLKNN